MGLYVGSTESMLQGCEIAPSSNDYIKSKKKIDANLMSQIIMAPKIQYFINILLNALNAFVISLQFVSYINTHNIAFIFSRNLIFIVVYMGKT